MNVGWASDQHLPTSLLILGQGEQSVLKQTLIQCKVRWLRQQTRRRKRLQSDTQCHSAAIDLRGIRIKPGSVFNALAQDIALQRQRAKFGLLKVCKVLLV